MTGVKVQVVRYVDDAFPGFVECVLVGSHGRSWTFVEKGPVVTTFYPNADSPYPLPGVIACEVLGRHTDDAGRAVVNVTTARPWDVASTEGITTFDVFAESITEW